MILRIGCLALICLAGGCASERSKPASLASGGATNSQSPAAQSAALPDKSVYRLNSTWTTDDGQPVHLAELRGRTQIVAMFFTSCQNACPITVTDMKRIEAALPEALRARIGFTLVSFDPARDTTAALHAYRLRRDLDPARWTLLRGEPSDVAELAARVGMKIRDGARGQFSHSNIITVLNPAGEIVHQQVGLNQDVAETVAIAEKSAGQ
jgi:protein SCO1/2